jgi:predicted porin
MIGGRFKVASVASIAAAGLFMGGVAAQAADLGGNCCADLEERVAELEAWSPRKGNSRQSLTIYGQVAYGVVYHDDPNPTADNEATIRNMNGRSGTRFGFRGNARVNADISMGFRIEIGVDDTSPLAGASGTRYSYVEVTSNSMGRVRLGQVSEATDGITTIKLGGAFSELPSPGESSDASPTAAAAWSNGYDGGRTTGVVYNTPTVGGFVVSAGWYNSGDPNVVNAQPAYDVALRYAGEFGAFRVAAGIGYHNEENLGELPDTRTLSGSASVIHVPTGLFLNGMAGGVENDNAARHGTAAGALNDNSMWGVSGGIARKWNSLGTTQLEVRYGEIDSATPGVKPTHYGVGVTQAIDAAAAEAYALFENYDCDRNCDANAANGNDDVTVLTFGMRVAF